MTEEEKVWLCRKWKFKELKVLKNVSGSWGGLDILSFRNDGIISMSDASMSKEFAYTIDPSDKKIHIPFGRSVLGLRICRLTETEMVLVFSMKMVDGEWFDELMELQYTALQNLD